MSTTTTELLLTPDTYYTREMDKQYMSVSQFKEFLSCEAATMAYLRGEYERESSDAMKVGSYVHAAFESDEAFAAYVEANSKDIVNTKGKKYAAYEQADEMIATLKADEMCMRYLDGAKEVIITAEFAGCMWKCKLDVHNPDEGFIGDIKTVAALNKKEWDAQRGHYVSWLEAYRYHTQLAVYSELEAIWFDTGSRLTPLIVAVTKESPPDKAIYAIDPDTIDDQLAFVESHMPRILAVKSGLLEPIACGHCSYCRAHKKVEGIIDWREIAV